MKKKLFTLLTLALCVCSGAWAEDEILYQFTMTATADVTMAASTTGNVDLVTNEKATLGVAGTAVEYFQGQSGSSAVKYIEAKKQDNVQSTNLRFTSNASYLKITLAAGETLQAGDIISWNSWNNAYSIELSFTKTSTRATTPATTSKSYRVVAEDGICGESEIYVWRATGSTAGFHDLTITRQDASKVVSPEISQEGNTITITSGTASASIYYTLDGSDPTTSSTLYSDPFDIDADCTIKAFAVKDGMTDSDISSIFCGADVAISTTTLINFGDAGYSVGSRKNGVFIGSGCSLNNSSSTIDGTSFTKRIQFGGGSRTTERVLTFKVNAPCNLIVYNVSNSSGSIRNFAVSTGTYSSSCEITKLGANEGKFTGVIYYAITGSGEKTVNISNDGSSDIGIYGFKVVYDNENDYITSIGSTGYATLSLPYKVVLPTGITAYKGTVNASSVTLTKVADAGDVLPANSAVVIAGSAGNYTFNESTGDAVTISDNAFSGTSGSTNDISSDEANTYYVLTASGSDAVLAQVTNSTYKVIPSNKAYLMVASGGAPQLTFDFGEGETTGINTIQGSELTANGEYHNLAGQRVAQPTKGLYIVNGRKVVIK